MMFLFIQCAELVVRTMMFLYPHILNVRNVVIPGISLAGILIFRVLLKMLR